MRTSGSSVCSFVVDIGLFLLGLVLLTLVEIRLRLVPYKHNRGWLHSTKSMKTPLTPSQELWIQRCKLAVRRAASRHPLECTCLRRSLALRVLLKYAGIQADLVYGSTPRPEKGGFDMHAWLVYRGQVIDTYSHTGTFISFSEGKEGNLVGESQ